MNHILLEISNLHSRLEDPEKATRLLFTTIEQSGKFPITPGDLSIAFVDDTQIAHIHGNFMNTPTPTDVITFPADIEMASAGEIIVSVDHAQSRAGESGESFSRELSWYLVHGWLHLAGYDDRNSQDRAQMRLAENTILAILDQNHLSKSFKLKA